MPEVFITAWDALVVQGGLTSGRWALIHAGASGVGTAGDPDRQGDRGQASPSRARSGRRRRVEALGADLVLERSPADWPAALQAGLAERGRHRRRRHRARRRRRRRGRPQPARRAAEGHDRAGRPDGWRGGEVNLGLLLAKRVRWIGTVLRSRPLEEKAAISRRFADEVLPLFSSGELRPVIDRRFPLADVADGPRHMEADANVGKILLDVR